MEIDFQTNLLSELPFFACLEPEVTRLLAFAGDRLTYTRGQMLFTATQKSDGGLLVLAGAVALFNPSRPDDTVGIVTMGGMIGEIALLAPTQRPVSAIAASACTVLRISRGSFLRAMREYPSSAEALRSTLADRVSQVVRELRNSDFCRVAG